MNILALDMACKTGFAHSDGTSGLYRLPPVDPRHNGFRFKDFALWLADFVTAHDTDAIVYEKAHHRGGATTLLAVGMVAVVELTAAYAGITRCKPYHSGTIKKHATGYGKADKTQMWEAAKKRGIAWTPETDDVIDALWLLDLALNDGELF